MSKELDRGITLVTRWKYSIAIIELKCVKAQKQDKNNQTKNQNYQ